MAAGLRRGPFFPGRSRANHRLSGTFPKRNWAAMLAFVSCGIWLVMIALLLVR
jgi:hypothetical protein